MRTEVKVEAYMLKVPAPKGSVKKTLDVERFRIVEVPTGRIIEAGIMNRQDAMSRALRKAARTDAKYTAKIRRRDVRKRVVRNLGTKEYVNVSEALMIDADPRFFEGSPILSREEHAAFDAFPLAVRAADARLAHIEDTLLGMGLEPRYAAPVAPRSSSWGAR